ncbi:MAG: hypothetical protein CVV02_16300 [Firmicutes bacterium HGW-Firmicutes-7]|nr:MAG: hypothetical protein CVV02_16300 [Firmicutes bacterium HGW-Firmicutes-7]
MPTYNSFAGRITEINDFFTSENELVGCYKLMTVQNREGNIVNFVVSPSTYFVDHTTMEIGNPVIGFYDSDAPVPLIYPPQYKALVMSRTSRTHNIKVDFFNNQLISSDGLLKLNIAPSTQILLENAQTFTQNLKNRYLIIIYGSTTRSIPAQTTPYLVIVMCSQ